MQNVVLSCALFLLLPIVMIGCHGMRPPHLGVKDGRLAPCPDSPNCVSSQSTDAAHSVAPLTYTTTSADAVADLRKIIEGIKRAVIIKETATYLHIEFTSALLRFVDDVEFFVDDAEKKIHVRSASRVGYSDLGVNRRRVERIRQTWEQQRRDRRTEIAGGTSGILK